MGLQKLSISRASFSRRRRAQPDDLICVIGSWGSLGTWIVRLLLQGGYRVRSSIPHTPEEADRLHSVRPEATEQLELTTVDLLDYGSLSDFLEGCTGVFYVPSPNYDINGSRDYPAEEINGEVRGVLNVVEACASTPSVRKLVVTSCLSTILWDRQYYLDTSSGIVLDEKNWSDLDFCRKQKMWSAVCKTLVEKAAWALAEDRGLELVMMNPATVAEPKSHHAEGGAHPYSRQMLDQSGIFAYVHVDELASAHVLAFEAEGAVGRYICFERRLSKADIVEAAREMYPDYPLARRLESFNPCVFSNEKLKSLQTNCIDAE